MIIFSGGGYQGFWKLEESIPVDGDLALAEDAKRYNQQLELDLGADNCHDIDRIMRLPGTVNIPDAKKKKKGRVETLAKLVEFNDNIYSYNDFLKAPALQASPEVLGGGSVLVKVTSTELNRIEDASELDAWNVPDRIKMIMAQGHNPGEIKEGDNSRSAWLFDFCCNLIRHKVPDEIIFAILTDPDWDISASVLELKGNAERYAMRQIQRAKEQSIDPKLVYFNERYTIIKKFGGRCMVITEIKDPALERTILMKMTLPEFEKGYENEKVQVGQDAKGNPKYIEAGTWWRKHMHRRQFDTITFAPERVTNAECYNLWQGFAVQAISGKCELFLDHVLENVCNSNEEHYFFLLGWMARLAQFPASAGEVAIVLRGGRGVGKSFFAKTLGRLFGRHYMQVSNSSHLVGNFNAHLRDLVLLFADEAFYANDKRHESILKTLITEERLVIEAKGVDVEVVPNYIHLIMCSNDLHVIPAGGDERRFFVLEVSTGRQGDKDYFAAIAEQMENGGYEALLHYLRSYDLSNFEVRDVPTTEALREQKLLSLSPDEDWWYQKLLCGQLTMESAEWPKEVMNRVLVDDYVEHTRRHNAPKRSSETRLAHFIRRVLPRCRTTQRLAKVTLPTVEGHTIQKNIKALFYEIPPLNECRKKWEENHGVMDWPIEEAQKCLPGENGQPAF